MNQHNLSQLWADVHARKARAARINRIIGIVSLTGVMVLMYALIFQPIWATR